MCVYFDYIADMVIVAARTYHFNDDMNIIGYKAGCLTFYLSGFNPGGAIILR